MMFLKNNQITLKFSDFLTNLQNKYFYFLGFYFSSDSDFNLLSPLLSSLVISLFHKLHSMKGPGAQVMQVKHYKKNLKPLTVNFEINNVIEFIAPRPETNLILYE